MSKTETRTKAAAAPTTAGAPGDFLFRTPAAAADPTIHRLAEVEEERQRRKLILIASESVCPEPVREILGSSFNNLYAEGYPSWRLTEAENRQWADLVTHLAYFRRYSDLRYYRGCEYADFVESIAQKRIKALFATDRTPADAIFANVQPLSGAAANNAVYQALVPLGASVVGMSLVEGGHLTHGSPANRSGKAYSVHHYGVSPKTGRIDYDQMEKLCREHRPKMLIGGASAYPFHIDWDRMRAIADEVGAFLFADVAHYAGLIAGRQYPNPIDVADVVSFTTHKSLCGARGAVILTRDRALAKKVDTAVFPGEQGGPHVGNIAAKAVAFHLAGTETFRALMANVVENSKALAAGIERRGVRIAYGGTESHLCLVDLRSIETRTGRPLTGEIAGRLLDLAGIVVNKNTVRGDRSAVHPSAVRLGTVWVSQLGYDARDMDRLAELITTVLTESHPFHYIEGATTVGRGKIDLDVFDGVRRGVDELVERRLGPSTAPTSGYPHFDADAAAPAAPPEPATPPADGAVVVGDPGLGVLEVESERAHYFMQSVGTADVSTLGPGDATRTFLLDRDGRRIGDVLVLRMDERLPGWRRYRVITHRAEHARVRRWFRALSDGYVLFDDEDVFRKLEGPVMVSDLGEAEPHAGRVGEFAIRSINEGAPLREAPEFRLEAVALLGGGAGEAFDASFPAPLAVGRHAIGRIGEVEVQAVREADGAYVLLVPAALKDDVVRALGGAADGGDEAHLHGWRAAEKLPAVASDVEAPDLLSARPDLFGREKVYFAGASHLPAPDGPERRAWTFEADPLPLRRTPLCDWHRERAGKTAIVPFGGWEMPVRYGSILEEHAAVRAGAGLFDVAHMGVLEVRGDTAQRFLDAVTSNYVGWLRDGECQYSYLLAPDGECLDDILVYRRAHDRLVVVVNAANAEKDLAWLRAAASGEFRLDERRPWIRAEGPPEIVDLRDPSLGDERRVDVALQGPRSLEVLAAAAANPALIDALRERKRFEFVEGSVDGIDALISTTGYTGEKVGYELLVHPDHLPQLWSLLIEKGTPLGLAPCGLGARDSTRIEAGFPLWGHELAGPYGVTPIEAGYGGSVKFHKPFFVGRDAMRAHEETRSRQIVRFVIEGKGRMARDGAPMVGGDGKYVGVVTSCTQVGDRQVGLALVDRRSAARGTELFVYRLPPDLDRQPPAKRMSDLEAGDAVLLPAKATVVKRFL
ncbi:MAG: glycine cleavage system aminomethyltransferase GcvT [Planctomycetota bacterium JB042]